MKLIKPVIKTQVLLKVQVPFLVEHKEWAIQKLTIIRAGIAPVYIPSGSHAESANEKNARLRVQYGKKILPKFSDRF